LSVAKRVKIFTAEKRESRVYAESFCKLTFTAEKGVNRVYAESFCRQIFTEEKRESRVYEESFANCPLPIARWLSPQRKEKAEFTQRVVASRPLPIAYCQLPFANCQVQNTINAAISTDVERCDATNAAKEYC
jgi:hypothetical protein